MTGLEILAISGLAMGLAGTAMSAYGQHQSGQAQASAAEYNAKATEVKGQYEEDQARKRLKHLMGTQRAMYAKAGVDLSSGSPLLILSDTAAEGEEEALNLRRGYQTESGLQKYYGKQAKKAGTIGAGSTFMTGLGQAATSYANYKG